MNYQELILTQITQHFAKAHLTRVRFDYDMINNTCNGVGLTLNKKEVPIELDKTEISMIQNLLIKKVKKLIDYNFIKFVISLDVENKSFSTYVLTPNQEFKKVEIL